MYLKSYILLFQYFCTVQIVAQKPKEFYNINVQKNQIKGSWNRGSTAGGRTNHSDTYLSRKFSTNPQYLIKNEGTDSCKCVIALSQSTMGIQHDNLLSIGNGSNLFFARFNTSWPVGWITHKLRTWITIVMFW